MGRFELAPGGVLEFGEGIGTEVGKRVTLEPSPKEFDRVEIGRIARQEVKVNATGGGGYVVAHQMAAMGLEAVPEDEQRLPEMNEQRFQELHHLFFGDGSIAELTGVGREVKAVIDFDDEAVGRKTIKLAYTTLERGQE